MDIIIEAAKFIAPPVAGALVTLFVSDPLKQRLAPVVTWLGSQKDCGVTGKWLATFTFGPSQTEYTELIEVRSLFGSFVGRILPSEHNHANAAHSAGEKPIRVRGTMKDNRFFTGVWMHPNKRSHHHGAFNLILKLDGNHMEGYWMGYSERQSTIDRGEWRWKRYE